MSNISLLPKPANKGRLSTIDILTGPVIPPIDRLRMMNEDDFEDLVLEWAHEYLQDKYDKIRQFGGSGDKGRDVIGYYKDGEIDIYQCKQYSSLLSPSTFWVELGKLCFYTFEGEYKKPKSYFIVTSLGLGPTLLDLLDNPKKINPLLINAWEDKCKGKIKKGHDSLTIKLKQYIEAFDFSILRDKSPLELIEEFRQTRGYASRFGGGLIKTRDLIPNPLAKVHARELNYTKLLFQAYSKKTSKTIGDINTLKTVSNEWLIHFEKERKSFYSTESLDKFSRDNFSYLSVLPFDELKEDSLVVLENRLSTCQFTDDIERLSDSKNALIQQEFSSNPLHKEIRPLDKAGMCHYLANEKKIKWEK
jgi:hypothetical protein